MRVFVVSSIYGVHAVFTMRVAAEAFLDAFAWAPYDEPGIMEHPLDPEIEAITGGRTRFLVRMTRSGEVAEVSQGTPSLAEMARPTGWFSPNGMVIYAKDGIAAAAEADRLRGEAMAEDAKEVARSCRQRTP